MESESNKFEMFETDTMLIKISEFIHALTVKDELFAEQYFCADGT